MPVHVTEVNYLEKYELHLTFNNGFQRVVDLQNELDGEIFEPLADLIFFQQVYLNDETGTIEWPNGADFAPEFLFEIAKDATLDKAQYRVGMLQAAV